MTSLHPPSFHRNDFSSDFSALHAHAESGSPELLGSKFGAALAPEHRL